ncbi:glycosyltransferase [uncultured Robinsoniella sp.]|uniref:glycosyltransferase n=1 Tax=uncultured Robinsoniella sp. TaxID=904190 RepID=UPI00374F8239
MKKKLLITASTFPRWNNDTEPRFILDLAEAMTDYFEVTVLVPAAPGAKEQEIMNGVKVKRYHYFPIHKLETLCYPGAIIPRIKEKKARVLLVPFLLISQYIALMKILPEIDVVQANWIIPQGVIQSCFKKPYVITGHGTDIVSMNKGIFKILKKRAVEKSRGLTVVSRHLKKEALKFADESKIKIISMGCKTGNFGKQFAVDNYFQQEGKKVVLFVGRLVTIKGVTHLIEAMKKVDAILIIVGDGPLRDALKKQARPQGNKIRFLGAKSHEELKKIYASADVFAAPSITVENGKQEGLGLVILEAMASGLPVVANKSGGITDLIHDGENGLYAQEKNVDSLSSKINLLLNDDDMYEKLSAKSLKTAYEYDYKVIADKYARLLEGV